MVTKEISITENELHYGSGGVAYKVDLDTDSNNGYYVVYRWDDFMNSFVELESYQRLEDAIDL
jgi:hypothetical protein